MNQVRLKRIMIRHAFFWAIAIVSPVVVMIVLDLLELHTPARVGLVSGLFLIVPFLFSHLLLGRELGRLVSETREQA